MTCFAGEFLIYPPRSTSKPYMVPGLHSPGHTESCLASAILRLHNDHSVVTCILPAGNVCCHELRVLQVLPRGDHWKTEIYLCGNN